MTEPDPACTGGSSPGKEHRPLTASVSENISAERSRQYELEQVHLLSHLGSCRFDRRSGWRFDRELLQLWGVESATDASAVLAGLIVPEDRTATMAAWERVSRQGGSCLTTFRMRHGTTGEVLHIQSRFEASVDVDGRMVRAIATNLDVSEVVHARELAEERTTQAAAEHALLLRRVSDVLASSHPGNEDVLQSITDFAAVALNSAAVLRILAPGQATLERDYVGYPDNAALRELGDAAYRSAQSFEPGSPVREQVVIRGKVISSIGRGDTRLDFQQEFLDRTGSTAEHTIIAPVRHEGAVVAVFSVFRCDPAAPYRTGDDDFVQVLADRLGSTIAERRGRAEAAVQQRELLEHLANTENRERSMLAEAIHDDPMQLIVAAILRIDNLRLKYPASGAAQMDQIADMLETAVGRLRRLIVAVTPPDFSGGLGVALHNLAEGIFSGTTSTVTMAGTTHVALTPTVKAAAYRILREALINVRKHADAENISIRLEEHEGLVIAAVTDDGVGTADLNAGIGHLGMVTMRARATAEGGHLDVSSTPGQGTTVELTLPISVDPQLAATPILRVFLVDDHDFVRRKVADLLEEEDDLTVVGEASTVAEALVRIPLLKPDVAVLDVRLPDGNGVQLCRELRSLLPGLNCLMLTSYTDEQAMTDAILAGAGGYVLKDIKGLLLVSAVRTVGSGRSLLDNRAAAALMGQLRARADLSTPGGLTKQEHLLLDLISKGLTNRQIGQRTSQTEQATSGEVTRLLAKLSARNGAPLRRSGLR